MPNKRNISTTKPGFGQSRSKAFNTSKRTFNPNKQTRPIPAADFAPRWESLADELARLPQPTVQAWPILMEEA